MKKNIPENSKFDDKLEVNSLKKSRDKELEIAIGRLVKPIKDSKTKTLLLTIFWWLGFIICLPLIFFPVVGWIATILIICVLISTAPMKGKASKKFEKDVSSYNSKIREIKDQIRIKYDELIKEGIKNKKEDFIVSKSISDESEDKLVRKQRIKQSKEKVKGNMKQKAKSIFASWLRGKDQDLLLANVTRLVVEQQFASASLVQRELRIDYDNAISVLDKLEAAGVIRANFASGSDEDILLSNATKLVIEHTEGASSFMIARELKIDHHKASDILNKLKSTGVIAEPVFRDFDLKTKFIEERKKVRFTDLIDLYE
jgi:hypothetical protein